LQAHANANRYFYFLFWSFSLLVQAEFENQLDAMMNELDWTLAREALLAEAQRVLRNFVNQFTDIWTQVSIVDVITNIN